MNAERLLAHYHRIADAPDAIARLRRFILNLAVRGKLVPQNPNDEPAAELLKRIAREIPASKGGRSWTGPMAYDVPKGWVWIRLGRLVAHSDAGWSPKTEDFPRSGDEWGVLKVSAVSWDKFRPWENKQVLPGTEPRTQAEVKQGDFLISRANTAELIARAVRVEDHPFKLMMSDKIVRLHLSANCDHRFVWIVNNYADFAREHYVHHASGVSPSMKNVSRDVILNLPFPLPPLAEQHRIVAKVDELMALCDRLEAARKAREATRDRLAAASLARLNAPDPDTFPDDARFVLNTLPALTARPDQIKQLRQTILNLAVRGKLVPQDPNDEPASELLKRIAKAKARLVKAGEIRPDRPLSMIEQDDFPMSVPIGWALARLATISLRIHYGFTASADFALKNVRLLRITDIQDNAVDWPSVPGCVIDAGNVDQYKIEKGDILIARTGGTIGKTFLVRDAPVTAVFASYLIRVQGTRHVFDEYLKLFLESPLYWTQLRDGARGTGQPNVNGHTLGMLIVSLPPLAEQHRIVAKVDELMALCDRLEASLATAADTSRRLLDALLVEALAPAESKLEAAQ